MKRILSFDDKADGADRNSRLVPVLTAVFVMAYVIMTLLLKTIGIESTAAGVAPAVQPEILMMVGKVMMKSKLLLA